MSEPKGDLTIDHQTVSASEQKVTAIELRIRTFQASPKEVMAWNFAQDPLLETMTHLKIRHHKGEAAAFDEYKKISTSKNRVYESGASLLVASVAYPEIFADQPSKVFKRLDEVFLRDISKDQVVNKDAPLSPDDIIKVSINRLMFKGLTYDDLYKIFIAAEMLKSALSFGVPQQSPHSNDSNVTNHHIDSFYANELYRTIVNKSSNNPDRRTQMLCLKAKRALLSDSIIESRSQKSNELPNSNKDKDQHEAYMDYINGIEKIFLKDTNINLNSPENRGMLHEFLWYLDANLYLDHNGKNDLYVFPAFSAQDAPQIGYPQGNRGYDYRVQTNRWTQRMFIQLKSKDQVFRKKTYHPLIRVLNEQSFQDINPVRLAKKLRSYRAYLEQPSEKSWQLANRFILNSVREFFGNSISDEIGSEHSERLLKVYRNARELPKNKSARRRMLKELGGTDSR